jgi:hypothetical protein
MNDFRYTLVCDGPSDQRLIPIINWTIRQHSNAAFSPTWADFSVAKPKPVGLRRRIAAAADLFPCDLLIVHRDGESATLSERKQEILTSAQGQPLPTNIPVVPIRMQETWLLFDLPAIRLAAGRPNGTGPLMLPALKTIEGLPDAKGVLNRLIRAASEARGRRLRRMDTNKAIYRLSELIRDFAPLRALVAFSDFETNLSKALKRIGA